MMENLFYDLILQSGVNISCLKAWNPLGNGKDLWDVLYKHGNFQDCDKDSSRTTSK